MARSLGGSRRSGCVARSRLAASRLGRAAGMPAVCRRRRGLALWGDERGVDGRDGFDAAAAFCRQDPSRHVLLIGRRGGRLVELGILSPFATLARRELAARGVAAAAIEALPDTAADQWDEAQRLAQWLRRTGRRRPPSTATRCGAARCVHCRPRGRPGGGGPRPRRRSGRRGPRRGRLVADALRRQELHDFLVGDVVYVVSRPAVPGFIAAACDGL